MRAFKCIMLFLLAVSLCISVAAENTDVTYAGLINYWPLDSLIGNYTVDSVRGYNLTLYTINYDGAYYYQDTNTSSIGKNASDLNLITAIKEIDSPRPYGIWNFSFNNYVKAGFFSYYFISEGSLATTNFTNYSLSPCIGSNFVKDFNIESKAVPEACGICAGTCYNFSIQCNGVTLASKCLSYPTCTAGNCGNSTVYDAFMIVNRSYEPVLTTEGQTTGLNFSYRGYAQSALSNYSLDNEFTFQIRFKKSNTVQNYGFFQKFFRISNTSDSNLIQMITNHTQENVFIGNKTSGSTVYFQKAYNYISGGYMDFILTFKNGDVKLYKDGYELNVTTSYSATNVSLIDPLRSAILSSGDTGESIDGIYDFIKIFNRSIGATEARTRAAQPENYTIPFMSVTLIDEVTGLPFNVSNLSIVRAYFENSSEQYDFKVTNNSQHIFLLSGSNSLRIELGYLDGSIITRYLDAYVVPNMSNVRVCANVQGVTHYEQTIQASSVRPFVLYNPQTDCIIDADYTRFTYEEGYQTPAFTINSVYYVKIPVNGQNVYLASLAGQVQSFYKLDSIEFAQKKYNTKIMSDVAESYKMSNTTVKLTYYNVRNDTAKVAVNITSVNTSANLFSQVIEVNPNDITIYFDTSTVPNSTANDLYRVTWDINYNSGSPRQIKTFFNMLGQSGGWPANLALAVAIVLLLLGLLTLPAPQALGWFGLICTILSLGVLSLCVQSVYTYFMIGISSVILIYQGFNLFTVYSRSVT